eukprot:ctg_1860.g518
MESLFDTPLTELVRGIRAHREDEERGCEGEQRAQVDVPGAADRVRLALDSVRGGGDRGPPGVLAEAGGLPGGVTGCGGGRAELGVDRPGQFRNAQFGAGLVVGRGHAEQQLAPVLAQESDTGAVSVSVASPADGGGGGGAPGGRVARSGLGGGVGGGGGAVGAGADASATVSAAGADDFSAVDLRRQQLGAYQVAQADGGVVRGGEAPAQEAGHAGAPPTARHTGQVAGIRMLSVAGAVPDRVGRCDAPLCRASGGIRPRPRPQFEVLGAGHACLHDADKNIRLRALALLTALVRDAESMRRTGELLLGQLRQQQTANWSGRAHDLHAFHNAVMRALLNSVQESTRGEWRLRTRGDFEWFLRQVLRPLAVELPSVEAENARQAAELLRDLAIRADEMRDELLQWSRAVLQCRYGREEAERKRQLLRIAVWMLGEYGGVEAVADGELLGECCVVDAAAVSQNGIVSAGAVAQSELLMALTKMQARRPDGLPPATAQALAQLVPHGVEERDRLRWLRRWMREGKQRGTMATTSFADGVHQAGVTVPRAAPVWPAEWHSTCWLDEAEAQEMQEQVQEVEEKATAGLVSSSPSSQPQPLLPFTPPRNAAPEGEREGRSPFYLTDTSTSALGGTAAPTSTVECLLFFDEEDNAGAEATSASIPSGAAVAAPAPDHPVHLRERATTASAAAARDAYEEIDDLLGDAELAPAFAAHPVPSAKPRRARRSKPRRRGGSQHTEKSPTADKDEQVLVEL